MVSCYSSNRKLLLTPGAPTPSRASWDHLAASTPVSSTHLRACFWGTPRHGLLCFSKHSSGSFSVPVRQLTSPATRMATVPTHTALAIPAHSPLLRNGGCSCP